MISRFAKSFVAIIFMLVMLAMVGFLHPPTRTYINPWTGEMFGEGGVEGVSPFSPAYVQSPADSHVVLGDVIMPKLGNATAKAELGRATWKLLHLVTLRYPETPTPNEREALLSYFHLTSRLYPCGECAADFQKLLKQFPPQTSSRRSASLWLCSVHNEVNKKLHKPQFDCAHLDAEYDCGCGDDPVNSPQAISNADDDKDGLTGVDLIDGR